MSVINRIKIPALKNSPISVTGTKHYPSHATESVCLQAMLADGKLFGDDIGNVIATLEKNKFESLEQENGIEVAPDWKGNGMHVVYFTIEDIPKVFNIFRKLGMEDLENIVPISFFKEPDDGVSMEVDVGMLCLSPITDYSLETLNSLAKQCHNQASAKFIEEAYNSSKDPHNEKLFIPRVIIRHPLKKNNMSERIVYNYEPAKFKEVLQHIGKYEKLFEEFVDSELKAEVMEDMEAAVEISRQMPVVPSQELAKNTILYGILHEISHILVLHMPANETDNEKINEKLFFELLRENVPNLDVDDLGDSIPGRLVFKNWCKALNGVQRYRLNEIKKGGKNAKLFGTPNAITEILTKNAYANEMFCDLFPMYLMEQVGLEHPYASEYGELLTEELYDFFARYLELIKQYYNEKRLFVFTDEQLAKSGMKQIMAIIAA